MLLNLVTNFFHTITYHYMTSYGYVCYHDYSWFMYKFDFIWVLSCNGSNHIKLLLMFIAEKVLLLLVISLTDKWLHVFGTSSDVLQKPNGSKNFITTLIINTSFFQTEALISPKVFSINIYPPPPPPPPPIAQSITKLRPCYYKNIIKHILLIIQ